MEREALVLYVYSHEECSGELLLFLQIIFLPLLADELMADLVVGRLWPLANGGADPLLIAVNYENRYNQ